MSLSLLECPWACINFHMTLMKQNIERVRCWWVYRYFPGGCFTGILTKKRQIANIEALEAHRTHMGWYKVP